MSLSIIRKSSENLRSTCANPDSLPANSAWQARYEALFVLQLEWTWTCACGTEQPLLAGTNVDGIGFNNIGILPQNRRDSVAAAMARRFAPENLGNFDCITCPTRRPRTEAIRIEGSPEYLRIKLSIVQANGRRNDNPVALPRTLDLTEYQAIGPAQATNSMPKPPLKYTLRSVVSHGGETTGSGHWAASVHGPKQVFYINDAQVHQQNTSLLKANPQVHMGSGNMQAVLLMYRRVHTR